jgi:tetratricopeptide (TPR) repeat protein
VLKQKAPKTFDTYVLEARTLVPKKRPGADAAPPPWQLSEAIQVLQTAEQNKEVRALARRAATDEEDAESEADAKRGTIVQLLEDWLQETVSSRPSDDPQPLKDLIEQYYRDIVKDNPARQLTQVPYLVRQGRRGEAANLIAKYSESTPLAMLVTACGTVLAVSDKEKQGLSAEQLAELQKQLAETEEILQKSLLKYQDEWKKAPDELKPRKQAEVLAITSVMANHYVNTKRYPEAVAMYTEILKYQPDNVMALNNRAMIMAARSERLAEAQSDISKAINRLGPLPMIVDSQAMVLLAAGKKPEALAAAKRVMSEKPDRLDPAVDMNLAKQWGGYYFHLALISDANDDAAGAADAMREAEKLGFGEADVFDLELPAWKNLVAKLGV